MEEQRDRDKLSIEIEQALARFCSSFSGAEPSSLERPGAVGEWAVRDVLAHVVFWHTRCLTAIRTTLDGTYQSTGEIDTDAENAAAVSEMSSVPAQQLVDRVKTTGLEVAAILLEIPEDLWQTKRRLQRWVTGTTLDHYTDHEAEIKEALGAEG